MEVRLLPDLCCNSFQADQLNWNLNTSRQEASDDDHHQVIVLV